jgi:hypothetical protein
VTRPETLPETAVSPPEPASERRRYPQTFGGLVYLVVVAASAIGLLVIAFGPWRRGVGIIGVALLLGALMRAVLPDRDAGMLRVRRNRWADVIMLGGVGIALLVLASVIPNQSA